MWEELGVSIETSLIVLITLYFIIKIVVRNKKDNFNNKKKIVK